MIVPGYLNPVGEALYEENNGYKLCDWYINKKYMNFKMELLNNLICRFNLEQYNDTLIKATDKLKAWVKDPNVPNIECKTWLWRQNYGIKQGEPISVQHIMALMCYTNYSKQSYEFTATYRQYGDYESDKDMKSRHREYWNWGKLLRETVECFGDFLDERVHHGINDALVFNSTSVLLCGPVSTTADFAIAANTFGAKGLVIDIPKDAIAFYFNCRYFSDFTSEDERLLIGGLTEIKFDTIRNMQPTPKQNYKVYVTALTIFHKMINGFVWEEKVKSRYRKVLKKLIKEEISGKVVKALPSNVPTYILHLWHHFLSTIKQIELSWKLITSELFYNLPDYKCFGFKGISSLFCSTDSATFDFCSFGNILPNLERIDVVTFYMSEMKPSISLNDNFKMEMLKLISLTKTKSLNLINIVNPSSDVLEFINNNKNEFGDYQWNLTKGIYEHKWAKHDCHNLLILKRFKNN